MASRRDVSSVVLGAVSCWLLATATGSSVEVPSPAGRSVEAAAKPGRPYHGHPTVSLADLPPIPADSALDRFGGLSSRTAEATGFFRVERIAGRWWLVDPVGGLFITKGVNSITPVRTQGGPGTLVLPLANSHSGGTVVESSRVVVANTAALGTGGLRVASGAAVIADVGAGEIRVASLAVDGSGRIDLGAGITSSLAAATPGRCVGWTPGDDGSLMGAFAAPGDVNLDGQVDALDVANVIAFGLVDTGVAAGWWQGDFTYDGLVDILDLSDMLGSGLYDGSSYVPVARRPRTTTII